MKSEDRKGLAGPVKVGLLAAWGVWAAGLLLASGRWGHFSMPFLLTEEIGMVAISVILARFLDRVPPKTPESLLPVPPLPEGDEKLPEDEEEKDPALTRRPGPSVPAGTMDLEAIIAERIVNDPGWRVKDGSSFSLVKDPETGKIRAELTKVDFELVREPRQAQPAPEKKPEPSLALPAVTRGTPDPE